MADDRRTAQAKVAEATSGVAALTTNAERLGPAKFGDHNPREKGDDAGAESKTVTDSVGPPAERKQERSPNLEPTI